jgi:nitrogen fixation protein FixH
VLRGRRRRSAGSGAAALVLSLLMGGVLTGGIGAVDAAAAVAAQARAETAADAAAHAAAAVLAVDGERERLSIQAQAGGGCDVDGATVTSSGPACDHAVQAARDLAVRNGGVLLRLVVGPDLRDVRADRGAGRLLTLVRVAVRRGLPVQPVACSASPGAAADVCWAEAWSAAQEAG